MCEPIDFIVLFVLPFIAGFLLSALFFAGERSKWCIRSIRLEHDLARAEGREPRNINSL